jgi:hypothetical protein
VIGSPGPTVLKTRLYERDSLLSSELQIALAPQATYQRLLSSSSPSRWHVLSRLAMILLVIAVMSPVMAVQRVTLGLVATAALSWSFVLLLQSIVGLAIIASAPTRKFGVLPALDLWFAGHVPYSLWMLVAFGRTALITKANMTAVILSASVPAIWTAIIVAAFCRSVLGTTVSAARWRAAAHFVSIWVITSSYIAWAAGGWFQLLP